MNSNSNEIKLKKICINTLKYISEDIHQTKNPIKYHNKLFNKNWNKNNIKLNQLFTIVSNNLTNIIINTSDDGIQHHKQYLKKWNNYIHDMPINYIYYLSKNQDMSFNDFSLNYYKRHITFGNTNFKSYITTYTDLNSETNAKINSETNAKINSETNAKINSETNAKISATIIDRLNYIQNGVFVSLDIKLYIENNIDSWEYYTFPHMNMDFFYSSKINILKKNKIIKNFYIISKWIYELFGNSTQKINFVYFDTPLKKEINKSYNFLSSQNVNSGLSSSGKILMVWRNEESSKVFIHELIHYLDKDVKYDNNFNDIIKVNLGNIQYPILINETITELQAQFFHTIYISTIIDKTTNTTNINTFKTIYNCEQIFSWYQFVKIMDFYDIKKFKEEYLVEKFNQSSNVFSYYILKSILGIKFGDIIFKLDHINNLINSTKSTNMTELNNNRFQSMGSIDSIDSTDQKSKSHNILIQNENKEIIIDQICNVKSCQKLVKHIERCLKNPPVKLMNKMIKHLILNNNSLRMTIFEI
jgi:hypothetical protein